MSVSGVNGLHHIALRVARPDLSASFYGALLGLRELARHPGPGHPGGPGEPDDEVPRAVWLALGEGVLMLERALRPPGASEGSAHVLVVAVDDLEVWAAKLAAAGLAVIDRTAFTLYFHDPDGHRVGVSTYRFER